MESKAEGAQKSVKERLADALSESIEGKPDMPAMPLYGSENVPISAEEEKEIES